MGGQGPPYPVRFQSFRPSRVPSGRLFPPAAFGSAAAEAGMSYRTQCTQVVLGALGSGASGSSTMRAKLFVPAGAPVHSRGGARSSPSQVYAFGMLPLGENAGETSARAMGASRDGDGPPDGAGPANSASPAATEKKGSYRISSDSSPRPPCPGGPSR